MHAQHMQWPVYQARQLEGFAGDALVQGAMFGIGAFQVDSRQYRMSLTALAPAHQPQRGGGCLL